jgi:hypothetical protein
LWAGVTIYFAVLAVIYQGVGGEPAGVTLLALAAVFGGLVTGWITTWRRRHPIPRPEDRSDADMSDDIGEVGTFPTASIRPLGLAIGMTGLVTGVVVGSWMSIAGLAILASQVALLTYDADPPER